MRILIASDLHAPTINGIATFGQNLARGLAAAGHEVAVVAPSQTGPSCEEADCNHRVVRTKSRVFRFYQNLWISLSPKRELVEFAEAFEPDIVHVQTPLGVGLAATRAAKQLDLPLVATNHSMSENFIDNLTMLAPLSRPLDTVLQRYGDWFYAHADHVTMPTQAAIDMLKPEDFRKPISAISNGIDLSAFQPGPVPEGFRARFDIPEDVPVVLYVGRVDIEKHLHVLVRAAKATLAEREFHLVIVGFGVDRERLERLVDELGMRDHVTFTGRVTEEDKPYFFRIANVFAMPSPAELQSISTLEAMASGLPVVAVDAGALWELCHDGRNGYLCKLDDVDGISRSLGSVLDDPELAAKMSAESLEIARQHDLATTIDRFVALYEQVIGDSAARRRV